MAIHGGHFANAGFDVSLETAGPGKPTVEALIEGRADFAVSGIMRSLGLVDQGGPPIVHFGTVNDRNGFFLLSRERRPTQPRLRSDRGDFVRIVRAFHAAQRWLAYASADAEYLQEILLLGGFIQNRHPYELLIDTEIATEALAGAAP